MAEAGTSHPRIFVSHSAKDNDFGAKLVSDLQRAIGDNDAIWYDVSGLQGGDEWWDKIVEELTTRDVFIIVLSPNSVVSRWVLRELNTAINEGKRIVPVLYQPCKVRADLKTIQIIYFVSPKDYDTTFNELLTTLGLLEPPPPPVPPVPGSPDISNDQAALQSKLPGVTTSPKTREPGHDISRVRARLLEGISHVSPVRFALLAGLAILVIIAGIFGFSFAFGGNQGNHTPGNATMTANAQLTATYQAYAAAAAAFQAQQANGTATAFAPTQTAALTAYQNPYPPHLGTLALNDPLRDNTQIYGWDENTTPPSCVFTGGTYQVGGSGKYTNACYAKSTNYSNFAFQVQMTIIKKGGCGGLVFRADNTSLKFYLFEVCTDGTYCLASITSAEASWLKSPTPFAAIHTYLNQANVLAVVASGSKFDLYINLEHITSVNDRTYSHGQVGVAGTGPTDQSAVWVAFSNAKVWTL